VVFVVLCGRLEVNQAFMQQKWFEDQDSAQEYIPSTVAERILKGYSNHPHHQMKATFMVVLFASGNGFKAHLSFSLFF